MELWQAVFLISLIVSMTVAIGWDSVLGRKFKQIEERQRSDPRIREQMNLGQMTAMGVSYRARQQALRLAEPERSQALRECAMLQAYSRTIMAVTALVFLAMIVSLLFR